MEKRHYIIIIAILVVLNVFSWRIWWESPRHRDNAAKEFSEKTRGHRGGGGMNFFAERLQLSSDQIKEFDNLKKIYFSKVGALNDSMNTVRRGLIKNITSEFGVQENNHLLREMGDYKFEIEKLTMEHFVSMRSVCNPEQKQTFDTLIVHILDRSSMFKDRRKEPRKYRRGEGRKDRNKE